MQILGRNQAMSEFARLMDESPREVRRVIAMQMLWAGDQRGVRDALALLQDTHVPDWQRANAALALQNGTAPEARIALEQVVRESKSDEIVKAAQEALSHMQRESPL
jgi:HEAT repeat protein